MSAPSQFFVGQRVVDANNDERIVRNIRSGGRVDLEPLGGPVLTGTEGVGLPPMPRLPRVGEPPPPSRGQPTIGSSTSFPSPIRPDVNTGTLVPRDKPFTEAEQLSIPPPSTGERLTSLGQTAVATGKGIAQVIADTYDPRTPEGRQAVAAEIGATAALATVSGPIGTGIKVGQNVTRVRRAVQLAAPIVGASIGGGVAAAGEEFLGTPPPEEDAEGIPVVDLLGQPIEDAGGNPVLTDPDDPMPPLPDTAAANVLTAAAQEGFYEVLGTAMIWVPRAAGRRAIQGRVARNAIRGLDAERAGRQQVVNTSAAANRAAIATLSASVSRQVRTARNVAQGQLEDVSAATRAAVDAAETQSRLGQRAATDSLAAVTDPGLRGVAGRQTLEVVEGGAQRVRDELGQSIETIAATGPDINILPLKTRAQDIFDREMKARIEAFSGIAPDAGDADTIAGPARELIQQAMDRGVPESRIAAMTEQLMDAGVNADVAEATIETARSPGMELLRKIVNAEDTVEFAAAHQLKQDLSAGINFGVKARTKPAQLAKAMRGGLSDLLNEYTPYAEANTAFGRVAKLMDNNRAIAKLKKDAFDNPESFVDGLTPGNATQIRLTRDLLLVPTAGEDAAFARRTWDTVRSAWTNVHVITKKGIVDLGKRLDAVDPETAAVLYGDPKGRAIADNLRLIDAAYRQAVASGVERTAAANAAGKAAKDPIRRAGREAIDAAKDAGAARRAELGEETEGIRKMRELLSVKSPDEQALATSTLATSRNLTQMQVDFTRAMFLSPGGAWQLISTLRLIQGPRGSDLIRWASHSPRGTRLLVDSFTSPTPGVGVAAIIRMNGFAEFYFDPTLDTSAIRNGQATQPDQTDPFGTPPPISFGETPRQSRLPQSATIGPAGQPRFDATPPP